MPANRVVHLTSVHSRYDTRIFLKECRSLGKVGYRVALIVADGKGDEIKEGIDILDVGKPRSRFSRMSQTTRSVLKKARDLDGDIYHVHDPELLPTALALKRSGKRVIFDAHEDLPMQLMGKPYLNRIAKTALPKVLGIYEAWACAKLDAIVTATPFIRDKFLCVNRRTVDINNYPLLGELSDSKVDWKQRTNQVCYIGGISSIRGILEVVEAMSRIRSASRLQIAGVFSESTTEAEVKASKGWQQVDELGFVGREDVRQILSRSVAGIVTFHPLPNHIHAQPNKMFEYMSAGIPVIASEFPLWREVIVGNNCGICVDPLNPQAIADAIDFMIDNPALAEEMGKSGKTAIYEVYNWTIEEQKLIALYSGLLNYPTC